MKAETVEPVEMLRRLVAFDTTSRHSNMALIDYVRGYLEGHGVASTLVPNEDGTKANLYATIGPNVEGGIVLSGHTDVVPVDGQPWETDPWELTEKGGKLFARGTCDMKAFSAVALALVPAFQAAGMKVPVHLALSYDEEIGCLGAHSLVERLMGDVPRPRAVIVGEPTMMGVVDAQNWGGGLITTFTGFEAHSSMTHLGVSAIHFAGDFIHFLNGIQEEMERRPRRTDIDTLPGHTTINVGIIHGGTAGNILARECVVNWGYRTLPGDDAMEVQRRAEAYIAETLLPAMRRRHPDADIQTRRRSLVPGITPEDNREAAALALRWTGGNRTYAVPYGTEAGIFRAAGIPTVICGPGDIAQAHQPNEFILASQVAACETFMRRLMAWGAAPS
ncbi:MAG: acetylornithine deacetylase [Rhodospirillales bacterium]|nr:MAG: acetylornithine deacetylase [Rhodospirillales bacterium]